MTTFQRDVINIIKNAITKSKEPISDDFDWQKGFNLFKKHDILVIFYYGTYNSGTVVPQTILSDAEKYVFSNISRDLNQTYNLEAFKKTFNENNADYLLLKGSILKYMYPNPEMRVMGDADILIRTDQYDKIEPLMTQMGYVFVKESDYEIAWNKPGLHIELHKRLIPDHDKDFYFYYGDDNWVNAVKTDGTNEYRYSDEDFYIYLFTHYARHYRTGGVVGIRHILDFYIYLINKPELKMEYIKTELNKLKLLDFYLNIEKTLNVWFENADPEPVTDMITDFIFDIGSVEKLTALEAIKQQKFNNTEISKSKRLFSTLFLPYKYMCEKYPVLNKCPVLLPVMWIVRFFDVILFKRKKIGNFKKSINSLDKSSITEHEKFLEYMGLEFSDNQ